jgi:uncharacterized protein (TIGR00290 family)
MRIAFLSGGKDSYYAVYKYGEVDLGLVLVYDFPRPNPHLINLSKSLETLILTNIPLVILRLSRGREFLETVEFLRKFNITTIVAGDVYIDEHLRYMERLSAEVGANLIEPLWGLDPGELMYMEFNDGLEVLVIGCCKSLNNWLGRELSKDNVSEFVSYVKSVGLDPLGERGEYHTLVLSGPLHKSRLKYSVVSIEVFNDYEVLRVI